MGTTRRTALTLAMPLVWLSFTPAPADAHSVAGVGATNYLTRLKGVSPEVPGLRVRVVEGGSRFELANTGGRDVVVLGYQGEPFLRVGPRGVFENRRSPATYLSATRRGDGVVPGTTDPQASPEWEQVSDGRTARWHDHRIHWMGDRDPPAVRRDPGNRHVVIPNWVIPMRVGDRAVEARGDLVWVPGPSPLPWLGMAAALLVVTAALGLLPRRYAILAVVLAALLAADVVHAGGAASAGAGDGVGGRLGGILSNGVYALFGWVAAVLGVWLLARRKRDGFYAAAVAGVLVAGFGGLAELTNLSRSQVPFAWSAEVARGFVAVSLGVGLGLLAAATLALRREPGE